MKPRLLVSALAVLFLAVGALRGYDILLNTDFDGDTSHWKDDPNATSCLVATASPDGHGIVIPLNPAKWLSIQQKFDTPDDTLILNVTYSISDGGSFDASGYRLPPPKPTSSASVNGINYTTMPLGRNGNFNPTVIDALTGVDVEDFQENLKPNEWIALIADPQARTVHYTTISSQAANPKTVSIEMKGLKEHEEKTLYLCFPPGTGSVTITHASLDKKIPTVAPSSDGWDSGSGHM